MCESVSFHGIGILLALSTSELFSLTRLQCYLPFLHLFIFPFTLPKHFLLFLLGHVLFFALSCGSVFPSLTYLFFLSFSFWFLSTNFSFFPCYLFHLSPAILPFLKFTSSFLLYLPTSNMSLFSSYLFCFHRHLLAFSIYTFLIPLIILTLSL